MRPLCFASGPEAVAAPLDVAESQSGATIDLPSGTTLGGIVFDADADATVVAGRGISLVGDITNNARRTQTVKAALTLTGGDRTLDAASGEIVIDGDITASGGYGIVKTGGGTAVLSGANSYRAGRGSKAGR